MRAAQGDAREQVVGTWPFRLVAHPELRAAGYDRIIHEHHVDLWIKICSHQNQHLVIEKFVVRSVLRNYQICFCYAGSEAINCSEVPNSGLQGPRAPAAKASRETVI